MNKVVVITDSVAGLPRSLQERYGIRVAPAILIWSGEEFRDGVDMQPADFYARLEVDPVLPTTAAAVSSELELGGGPPRQVIVRSLTTNPNPNH